MAVVLVILLAAVVVTVGATAVVVKVIWLPYVLSQATAALFSPVSSLISINNYLFYIIFNDMIC